MGTDPATKDSAGMKDKYINAFYAICFIASLVFFYCAAIITG